MDKCEVKRVFDQVKPTPEQEQAMLDRLLEEQKEVKPVSRMKKMTAVLVAAALLLMACAFTVATGVDQRLLALFRGDEQDAQQITEGVVSVGERYSYDNGWTVEVEQVLVDRYSLAVLVDLIGPEGTVMNGEDCFIDFASEIIPEDGEGVGSYVSGSTVLEDENPEDNRISFLWQRGPSTFLKSGTQSLIGCEISLRPTWLTRGGSRGIIADFRGDQRTFTIQLPEKDSGWTYQLGCPIQVDEETMTLESLYISPISVACFVNGTPHDARMWGPPGLSDIYESLVLNMANGDSVTMSQSVSQTYNPESGEGRLVFQTEQIIQPENVVSVTLLGQTFSLEGLAPAAE
ncbi:hypothetical protein ACTQ4E_02095 [Lawsonibacter sp. LCP25S3_G6]|uniref:hypothetical protein n=1 Tax=unclassified Lawsonibacter TaxID=2617946 RepID=UPI003F94D41F